MLKEDSLLLVVVFAIWAALTTIYLTVPMVYMPGNARVWGMGALLFLILAGVVAFADRHVRKQ